MILNKEETMQRRNTLQRQMVYNALNDLGHASVESLIEYMQLHYQEISLATIYRNIHILLEEQKIKRVQLKDREVLETVKEKHGHFICEKCGMIYDVPVQNEQLIHHYEKSLMQQINDCDVAFYGLCQKCKNEEEEKNEVCM